MYPPGYRHNGFVATHALGHIMYGYHFINCISCYQLYIMLSTVHHVPKYISCYKAIVVITWRVHCFQDCICITLILLLWDLSTVCVVDHLWPLIWRDICIHSTIFISSFINLQFRHQFHSTNSIFGEIHALEIYQKSSLDWSNCRILFKNNIIRSN